MNIKRSMGISITVGMAVAAVLGVGTALPAAAGSASAWSIQALPTPGVAPNGHLSAVSCTSEAACWAVGHSTDGRGAEVALAERWDGARWILSPTPAPAEPHNSSLTGISCSDPRSCTAVGNYVAPSGVKLPLIERWNGRRWELQSSPAPAGATENFLTAISCASPAACSAVGYSRRGAEATTPLAEEWDGARWRLERTPTAAAGVSSRLTSVSCSAAASCTAVGFSGDMFAGAQAVVERRDGTRWTAQSPALPAGATTSLLSSVSCASATQCVAVGRWHDGGKGGGTLAEVWNGTAWAVQPTPGGPVDVYTAVSCPGVDQCLALGKSGLADFVAAEWQGAAWTSVAAPASGTLVDSGYAGLSCTRLDACVAVGTAESADFGGTYRAAAAGWNGSTWTAQPAADSLGTTPNELVAVSCATTLSCVAVGFQWRSVAAAEPLAEHWNGVAWSLDRTPAVQGASLSAVSCASAENCLAVGGYVDGAGRPTPLAERWNGRSWRLESVPTPVGSGAAGFSGVSCLGAGGGCVAVGEFADAKGAETALVERSGGSGWEIQPAPVPAGTAASALQSVSCGTPVDCTAVGAFATSSPTPFSPPGPCDFSCMLAEHWNGATWQPAQPPAPTTSLNASLAGVSCLTSGTCISVGQWTPQDRAGGHPGISLAEYWTGSGWTIQPTPDPPGVGGSGGTNNSPLEAVSCTDPLSCTAVGDFDSGNADNQFLPLAEHTDGHGWSVQTVPAPLGSYVNDLRGVSCPDAHTCMAVGMSYRYDAGDLSPGPHVALAEAYQRP